MFWKVLIQVFKLQYPDSFNSVTISLNNLSCASLSDQSHLTYTKTHILGWGVWKESEIQSEKHNTKRLCKLLQREIMPIQQNT